VSLEGRIFENELLRDAMKLARVGLCVADEQGRVIVLAGDFAEKLGVLPEKMIGNNIRAIFEGRILLDITEFGITRDRYLELRHQLDALNTVIVVVDTRSSEMPIVYVNRRFEQMTGYTAEESVGRNCQFLRGEDREQPGIVKLRQAISLGQSCHVVLRNYRKDGSVFNNELLISPVADQSGNVVQFIGLQREVGERNAPSSNWIGAA